MQGKLRNADLTSAQRWTIMGGAALMLSLAMGMRQTFGLFQPEVVKAIGITSSDYSLALALQNAIWGITQPFVGLIADRYGSRYVMLGGALCYAVGLVVVIYTTSAAVLILGMGFCIGVALSCTATSITMSVTTRAALPARRSIAMGAVAAMGSLGLVVASPLAQTLMSTFNWQIALVGFLGLAAVMVPAALLAGKADGVEVPAADDPEATFRKTLQMAFGHSGYVTMALAFFVCGLQLVFMTNHLPNYLAVCGMDPSLSATALALIGLFNVFGCYLFGWLGNFLPKQYLLGGLYITRSLAIGLYFAFPPTPLTTMIFAATLGTLWLGAATLINGLVAQLFGLRFMATLTGIAFLSHQTGSFIGAWGGGLIYDFMGNYDVAWKSAVVIGLIAGTFQLTMNVRPPKLQSVPQAAPATA
jgi:predicted MFS family arabinose efflux permease